MKRVTIAAISIGGFLIAFYAMHRFNGESVTRIVSNNNSNDTVPQQFSVNISGYQAKDYPLPSLPGADITINRYSNCNFCLTRRPNIAPAGNVSNIGYHQFDDEMITAVIVPSSFGGAG